MHQEQRQQTHALLKQRHINQAVFAKLESIRWLTGFAPPIQIGPNLFASGNPLVWYDDGHFTLIVVSAFAELAASFGQEADGSLVTYEGYSLNEPIASGKHLVEAFNKAAHPGAGKIGVEQEFVSGLITSQFGAHETVAIDGWLEPLRMVKTAEELDTLRRNFALTDLGHKAAREATVIGKREIDVWTTLEAAIQNAAGCRVPLNNDCVVGRRSFNIGGWPLDYELLPHDSIIVDVSVILDGYWSDSCATYYAGERTAQQAKMHRTIQEALEFATSLARPGAVAREIDQKTRQFVADAGYPVYPHHTGHGVGVSGHEAPRIVPYNDEALRPGMVIMLEPGTYIPGQTGVRLEDGLLITADGAELLTHHDKS